MGCSYSEPVLNPSDFCVHPELNNVLVFLETVKVKSIDGVNDFLKVQTPGREPVWHKTNITSIKAPPMTKEYYLKRYCKKFFGRWVYTDDELKYPQEYYKL